MVHCLLSLGCSKEKIGPKAFYEVNEFATSQERRQYANRIIREINKLLEDGYHLDVNKPPSVEEPEEPFSGSLIEALEYALEIKKASIRPSSYPSYKSSVKIFTKWAVENKIAGMEVVLFDKLRAVYFDDYLFHSIYLLLLPAIQRDPPVGTSLY